VRRRLAVFAAPRLQQVLHRHRLTGLAGAGHRAVAEAAADAGGESWGRRLADTNAAVFGGDSTKGI
jgi:hypothetical protein